MKGEGVRSGLTLPELMIVLVIAACLLGVSLPLVHRTMHRAAVTNAGVEVASLLAVARHQAILRRVRAAVRFESSGVVTVFAAADTFARRDLRTAYGVTLTATRDSIAYGPTGRGYGAANTTVVLRRGGAHDSVVVSRLGRVRRR